MPEPSADTLLKNKLLNDAAAFAAERDAYRAALEDIATNPRNVFTARAIARMTLQRYTTAPEPAHQEE